MATQLKLEYMQGTIYSHNDPAQWVPLASIDSRAWDVGKIGAAELDRIMVLISRAPELLADMERIVDWCLSRNDCKAEILHCARTAIDNAREE
jgi:hypothetical protein